MSRALVEYCLLFVAGLPFIYYALSFYSSWNFFRSKNAATDEGGEFLPPVSNIKPIRGLDPDAYENFASLCRQDYPEYELLFCLGPDDKAIIPVLEKLARDFPERKIRIISGSGRTGSNDKVAKLARLVEEAQHEVLVINDSDVRVRPDYLRTVVAPLRKAEVGAVTCLYVSAHDRTFADRLQSIGMLSDFFPGIFVARQLDGVKFALGTTIATTRSHLAEFGGYAALENRPADDLLVGRLIADSGREVQLLPYAVETVPDYASVSELWHKRLRWTVVMRHMRPWGHLGILLTLGLPWTLLVIMIQPSAAIIATYFGTYALLRVLMTCTVGMWGLKRRGLWKQLPLILVWDAFAAALWAASFFRSSIRWRNGEYYIRNGSLVPVALKSSGD